MKRRKLLSGLTTAALASTAGCSALEDAAQDLEGRSVEDVKQNAEQVPYEKLYRNISDYENKAVYWPQAHLSDVVSGQDTKEYLFTLPGGDFADTHVIWGVWHGDPFKDGDDVEIWGIVEGLKTYTSLTGEQTVPKINIKAMKMI